MKEKIILQPHQVIKAKIFLCVSILPFLLLLVLLDFSNMKFLTFALIFGGTMAATYLLGRQYMKHNFGVGK